MALSADLEELEGQVHALDHVPVAGTQGLVRRLETPVDAGVIPGAGLLHARQVDALEARCAGAAGNDAASWRICASERDLCTEGGVGDLRFKLGAGEVGGRGPARCRRWHRPELRCPD